MLPLIPRLERGSTDGRRPRGTFGLPAFRLIPSFSSKGDPVVRFRSVLVVSAALAAAFACSPPPEEPAATGGRGGRGPAAGEYLRFEDVSGEAAWGRVEGRGSGGAPRRPVGGRSADRTAGSPRRSPPARTRRARQGDRHRAQLRLASRGPRARRLSRGFRQVADEHRGPRRPHRNDRGRRECATTKANWCWSWRGRRRIVSAAEAQDFIFGVTAGQRCQRTRLAERRSPVVPRQGVRHLRTHRPR